MPVKKWLVQYTVALPVIMFILTVSEILKGRDLLNAIEFAAFWGILSITLFAVRRAYMFRTNIACVICNDISKRD